MLLKTNGNPFFNKKKQNGNPKMFDPWQQNFKKVEFLFDDIYLKYYWTSIYEI